MVRVSVQNISYPKALVTLLMAGYGSLCALHPSEYHLIDGVNLVAHEAGHLLFSWFGEFIMVIGGTIGQLLVPCAFTVYFFLRREFFSATVTLLWVGQNFCNISVYAGDAQAMNLPLVSVGGDDAIHDWNYILAKAGLLRWDRLIANTIRAAGVIIMSAAVIGGIYFSFRNDGSRTSSSDGNDPARKQ